MRYCSECGKELSNATNYCTNCGSKIKNKTVVEQSIPVTAKNGKATASMVLGIIAVVWAFFVLIALDSLSYDSYGYNTIAEFIGFFIGFNFVSLPCGIISLSLGLSAKNKCKKRTAGIVTSAISLGVALLSLIVMMITL